MCYACMYDDEREVWLIISFRRPQTAIDPPTGLCLFIRLERAAVGRDNWTRLSGDRLINLSTVRAPGSGQRVADGCEPDLNYAMMMGTWRLQHVLLIGPEAAQSLEEQQEV